MTVGIENMQMVPGVILDSVSGLSVDSELSVKPSFDSD